MKTKCQPCLTYSSIFNKIQKSIQTKPPQQNKIDYTFSQVIYFDDISPHILSSHVFKAENSVAMACIYYPG